MNEAQWLACSDPGRLLKHSPRLCRRPQDVRLVHLVGVAFCRSDWTDATPAGLRRVVDVAERFADGLASVDEMAAVAEWLSARANDRPSAWSDEWSAAYHLVRHPGEWRSGHGVRASVTVVSQMASRVGRWPAAIGTRAAHADIVRDILGNPFRPVAFAPEWRTADAAGLAEAIYERRAFHDLPILADALQDAGCDSPDLLDHLRGPGPHARGCWALDLVSGRG